MKNIFKQKFHEFFWPGLFKIFWSVVTNVYSIASNFLVSNNIISMFIYSVAFLHFVYQFVTIIFSKYQTVTFAFLTNKKCIFRYAVNTVTDEIVQNSKKMNHCCFQIFISSFSRYLNGTFTLRNCSGVNIFIIYFTWVSEFSIRIHK